MERTSGVLPVGVQSYFWSPCGLLVQPSAVKQGPPEQLLRTMSSQILNVPTDGGTTNALVNLFQCLTTCTVCVCVFVFFNQNLVCFSSCPRAWLHLHDILPLCLCARGWDPPEPFLLQAGQPFLICACEAQMCPDCNLTTLVLRSTCQRIKIITWETKF